MDELDALFAGQSRRSLPPSSSGRAATTYGGGARSSGAPWDDGVPAAEHPSEVASGRVARPAPAGRDDRAAGSARVATLPMGSALAPSVVRTSVPRGPAVDNVAQMPSARDDGAPEDIPPDWHGGDEQRSDSGQQRPKDGARDYFSCHVYGGKAALCFNADTTKAEGNTVRLEAAPSRGARSYDWERKVAIQFTIKEMPFVLAVFMGWLPSVQFSAHGPKQDKGFSFEHQKDKVFARVWQGKEAQMAVPVFAEDMFAVVDVMLRQMVKNSPHLGVEGIIAVVRQLAQHSLQYRGLEVKKPPAQRSAA